MTKVSALNHEGISSCDKAIVELHYLPCIAYFGPLLHLSELWIERHEHYVKQTYRNRCHINTAHGKHSLTIPLTAKHGTVDITDVRIDYSQKWLANHWRTIVSAYAKAPFFDHYAQDLETILFRRYGFLYDLNRELLSMCLNWLKLSVVVKESLSYSKRSDPDVMDLRMLLNPKKTESEKKIYTPVPYYQIFGSGFVENLSLIDLIFCTGPEAGRIVKASTVQI